MTSTIEGFLAWTWEATNSLVNRLWINSVHLTLISLQPNYICTLRHYSVIIKNSNTINASSVWLANKLNVVPRHARRQMPRHAATLTARICMCTCVCACVWPCSHFAQNGMICIIIALSFGFTHQLHWVRHTFMALMLMHKYPLWHIHTHNANKRPLVAMVHCTGYDAVIGILSMCRMPFYKYLHICNACSNNVDVGQWKHIS